METPMIDAISFPNLEIMPPCIDVHRRMGRQGENAGVVFPPKESDLVVDVELLVFGREFPETKRFLDRILKIIAFQTQVEAIKSWGELAPATGSVTQIDFERECWMCHIHLNPLPWGLMRTIRIPRGGLISQASLPAETGFIS